MKKLVKYLFILPLISLTFASCNDDNEVAPALNSKTFVIDSSKDKWVYFSFDKADTVKITNPSNSTDWDLAFNQVNLRTNSGQSGKGMGGAYATGKITENGFDSVKVAPGSMMCKYDTIDNKVMSMSVHGYITDTVSKVLNTWYSYDFATHKINPSNEIFVIKTASGKYVKIWLKSYYKDEDASPGFLKFTYMYQADGSTKLE